jgi:L-amino acid N-acyltransferase YncA
MVATGLLWQAYELFLTVHWIKVLKEYEGRGLGRALLSRLFAPVTEADLPMYLHTQPESFRAIKLYTDFGFELLTDPTIGTRENHVFQSLPFLKQVMSEKDYQQLKFTKAPPEFLHSMAQQTTEQF